MKKLVSREGIDRRQLLAGIGAAVALMTAPDAVRALMPQEDRLPLSAARPARLGDRIGIRGTLNGSYKCWVGPDGAGATVAYVARSGEPWREAMTLRGNPSYVHAILKDDDLQLWYLFDQRRDPARHQYRT